MTVDVITVLNNGVIKEVHVVEHTATAEATFDFLAREEIGWTEEQYEEEFENISLYETRYDIVNDDFLRPLGKEIVWLTEVEVNRFN